jgi:hypothetical protein
MKTYPTKTAEGSRNARNPGYCRAHQRMGRGRPLVAARFKCVPLFLITQPQRPLLQEMHFKSGPAKARLKIKNPKASPATRSICRRAISSIGRLSALAADGKPDGVNWALDQYPRYSLQTPFPGLCSRAGNDDPAKISLLPRAVRVICGGGAHSR